MMDLLKRDHAPILEDAWDAIDNEARRVLKLNLAGRKLVDFNGPFGWQYAAVNLGRLELLKNQPLAGVS
ncbi:MAG: family 1 encapsulin nanocompartment shell protein, partial [Bacteroidota bacterium]